MQTDPHLKVIRLRRNFGQTAALSAGFHEAQGNVIIAMDGDLQHAPEDIPALLDKIEEGYDIASGWRKERVDNAMTRKIPSRIANWLMSKASGIDLRDFGTTFKAYRAEDPQGREPVWRVAPLHPGAGQLLRRARGGSADSEYPRLREFALRLGRTFRVLFDILTIRFLLKYFTRPMHFFGTIGLFGAVSGTAILGYCLIVKIFWQLDIIIEHGPLMIAGALLLLAGLMMFSDGG